MHRRQVLVLLAGLLAGCNAQDTATDTPTATATETATPTDTPTATATPGGPEREGNEAIAEVLRTLNNTVGLYGVGDSVSILGTDASSTTFPNDRVQRLLVSAEEELETARERAVTRDQQRTVDRLSVAIRFLTLATRVQIALGNTYFALSRARTALDQEDGQRARDRLGQMQTERSFVATPLERIRTETDAASVSVVDRIPASDYEAKVAQFEAESGALGRIRPPAERLSRGVGTLRSARARQANNPEGATETARQALQTIEEAEAGLQTVLDGLSEPADSLVGITQELVDIAAAKAAAAREIAGETPTPAPTETN